MQTPPRRAHSPRPRELSRRSSRREAQPTIDMLQTLLSQPSASRQSSFSRASQKGPPLPARKKSSRSGSDTDPREVMRHVRYDSRDDARQEDAFETRHGSDKKEHEWRLLNDEAEPRISERSRDGGVETSLVKDFHQRVSFAEHDTKIDYEPGDSSDDEDVEISVTPRGRGQDRGPGKRSATPFVRRRSSSRSSRDDDDDVDDVDDVDDEDDGGTTVMCQNCGHVMELQCTVVGNVDIELRK